MEQTTKNNSDIYFIIIQVLFGIVIGISFIDYHDDLVPFTPNFETLLIVTPYFTVLASFAGYSITIKNRPHRNVTRFIIDLFLLYLYYQLIYSVQFHFKYFLAIFPLIFGSYIIWQILEYREWKGSGGYKFESFKNTLVPTIVFFIAFLGLVGFNLTNDSTYVIDMHDSKLHYVVSSTGLLTVCIILVLLTAFRIWIYKVNK